MKTKRQEFLKYSAGISCLGFPASNLIAQSSKKEGSHSYPDLIKAGDDFSVVIMADPQVMAFENKKAHWVSAQAAERFVQSIREINQLNPQPAFVLINGDLVEAPQPYAFDFYASMAKELKAPQVNIIGNHDGPSPYKNFIEHIGKPLNKVDKAYWSWDTGQYHFLTFPTHMNNNYDVKVLEWLNKDLETNKNKPVIVFIHYHLIPQGITQLEYYTYPMHQKQKIIKLLTKYGNVRYVFNGHVHCGLKASVKTSWFYKGIKFIDCPTTTMPRNFGEEYDGFKNGLKTGGYYLIMKIKGDKVMITGKLTGNKKEYRYPETFPEFKEAIEPRWFAPLAEMKPNPELINGSFEQGLKGWLTPYRYKADSDPGFVVDIISKEVSIYTREKGVIWARDEMTEVYQLIKTPPDKAPLLNVKYKIRQESKTSGMYIRVMGFRNNEFKFIMIFDKANNRAWCINFPKFNYFTATGNKGGSGQLQIMGKNKQAMFWQLPHKKNKWNTLLVDIQDLYDKVQNQPGKYNSLKINKLFLGMGTWTGSQEGSESGACFDDARLTFTKTGSSKYDKLNIDESVFKTKYGDEVYNRDKKNK